MPKLQPGLEYMIVWPKDQNDTSIFKYDRQEQVLVLAENNAVSVGSPLYDHHFDLEDQIEEGRCYALPCLTNADIRLKCKLIKSSLQSDSAIDGKSIYEDLKEQIAKRGITAFGDQRPEPEVYRLLEWALYGFPEGLSEDKYFSKPVFNYTVGCFYETQDGKQVQVIGRTMKNKNYECLICDDYKYRYDRSGDKADSGRATGTNGQYISPDNFLRPGVNMYVLAKEFCKANLYSFDKVSGELGSRYPKRRIDIQFEEFLASKKTAK